MKLKLQYGGTIMSFRLEWPTKSRYITQNFLANYDFYMRWNLPGHEGLDIGTQLGDEVYACADGVVSFVQTDPKSHNYGIHVRIQHKHSDGIYKTSYAHLQAAAVSVGDRVKAGQLIGYAGITGNTQGNILHLTLKKVGATKAGETRFYNERGAEVEMPSDFIDPSPFLDPQPSVIPVRPVLENHPSSPLLDGGSPYVPNQGEPDLYLTQPIVLHVPQDVNLCFIYDGQEYTYQVNKGLTIRIQGPPPDEASPQLLAQPNGIDYDYLLNDDITLRFHAVLPWQGENLQVSHRPGIGVRLNPTLSSREVVMLPYKTRLTLSTTPREIGLYIWRQIIAPEAYEGVNISQAWVIEQRLDTNEVFLSTPKRRAAW
jgi:hypothetical protein